MLMIMFMFRCYSPNLNFMLFREFSHLSFELAAIVALKYLGLSDSDRTNLVNVGYVCSWFRFQRSSHFVSGSNIDSGKDILVLISI